MPQWADAKWTRCLCQVVRGLRGSLQFLPHRNTYSTVSSGRSRCFRWSCFIITGITGMFHFSDNGDDGRAAAALADNTAALLLFYCCVTCVCACVGARAGVREMQMQRG